MDNYYMNPQMQYQPPMGIYDEQNRMLVSPEQQLESLYPRIYYMVNPVVQRYCDMLDNTYGLNYAPTNEEAEQIIENILMELQDQLNNEFLNEELEDNAVPVISQSGSRRSSGNPLLRGLIGTLLIGELLSRRRGRGSGRYPGYYYPYYPGFYPGFIPPYPGFF